MTDPAATSGPNPDPDLVRRYGAEVGPAFGGTYLRGDLVVALFAVPDDADAAAADAALARHEQALRARVAAPDRLRVRRAPRGYAEVEATNARLPGVLDAAGLTAVRTVGIAVHDEVFTVEVGLAPYDEATAARVRALAAPDPVVVRAVEPPRLFGAAP